MHLDVLTANNVIIKTGKYVLPSFSRSGPYFIKVKIILNLRFKMNLIVYLIKEFMKNSCVNFFYEIVNKISIQVKRNSKFKEFAKT